MVGRKSADADGAKPPKQSAITLTTKIGRIRTNMSRETVLSTSSLGKQVSSPEGPLTILEDITLEIASGEAVALVGPSGAGKTTLLALLAGLDRPTSGGVRLCGENLETLDEDGRARVRGHNGGFVFQSFHLVPSLTALENVMLPLELTEEDNAAIRAREALDSVGLGSRTGHYPRQLSGGEKQRVAIARAFVTSPAVLFADEPTGNLDAASGDRISNLLFDMNSQSGTTLVLVTHDKELASRCDRVLQIEAGRLAV
jgi:putative ABC transport system ATP-binding protein